MFPKFSNPTPFDAPLFLSLVVFVFIPEAMVSSLLLDIFRLFFLFSSFEPLSSFRLRSAPDAFALEDPFVLFADDARVLLLFAFEPPLPRVVVFVVGFRLRGEESFEWCRRSSSSLLVSLKSFSVVLSSKDKFRTPSLKEEEGAFEFVPPIGVLFFSFSRVRSSLFSGEV